VQARADASGWRTYEEQQALERVEGLGKIEGKDVVGFGKGLVNSPGAQVEGIANLVGADIKIGDVIDYEKGEEAGAWVGEGLGPGPAEVGLAAKALGTPWEAVRQDVGRTEIGGRRSAAKELEYPRGRRARVSGADRGR
jgi:hypothetical protein